MKKIIQYQPSINEIDKEAITNYLNSGGFITEYKVTQEFEKAFSEYTGSKYAIAFPNGTLSLMASLAILGLEENTKILVPNFTMAATAMAPKILGYDVVFCDVEYPTLCIDLELTKQKIDQDSSIKVIMLVSANGRYPSYEIEELIDFAKKKGIYIIEDAAQSLGSYYPNGAHIGTMGEIGSFSFSMPKIITTGQGGMLITDDKRLADRLRRYKDFGREKSGNDIHSTIGLNLKFTDLQATLGLSQMEQIEERRKIKKQNYEYLKRNIKNDAIKLLENNTKLTTPWFYEILCEERDHLKIYLEEQGIQTRVMYPELNKQTSFADHPQHLEEMVNSKYISSRGLWLPSHPDITREEFNNIIDCLNNWKSI